MSKVLGVEAGELGACLGLAMHASRSARHSDVSKIRRFALVALTESMLLVGISCGSLTPSGGQGAATGSTVGRGSGTLVSGQPAYATALQAAIESVMKANTIPGAIVLIKSRDKGDWRATLGSGQIGKSAPLYINGRSAHPRRGIMFFDI